MNVFDSEAEIADQDTAVRWFLYAQAGCNLEESRAFYASQGSLN
jgi:hypothetical protein